MKKTLYSILFTSSLFFACNKKEITPLVADFEIILTGEAPNATVSITDNTTGHGLLEYLWKFSEGANSTTSELDNPTALTVDKAGDFTVILIVGDQFGERELIKTAQVSGNSAILTYSDLEFGNDTGVTTYAKFFSVENGAFKAGEIPADNSVEINLAFGSCGRRCFYFENPAILKNGAPKYKIPNATVSKVINYEVTPTFSVIDVEAMSDDALLSPLSIDNERDAFGFKQVPGTMLFEITHGRKGIIKAKEIDAERILVDIKVQKY